MTNLFFLHYYIYIIISSFFPLSLYSIGAAFSLSSVSNTFLFSAVSCFVFFSLFRSHHLLLQLLPPFRLSLLKLYKLRNISSLPPVAPLPSRESNSLSLCGVSLNSYYIVTHSHSFTHYLSILQLFNPSSLQFFTSSILHLFNSSILQSFRSALATLLPRLQAG